MAKVFLKFEKEEDLDEFFIIAKNPKIILAYSERALRGHFTKQRMPCYFCFHYDDRKPIKETNKVQMSSHFIDSETSITHRSNIMEEYKTIITLDEIRML